MLPNKDISKRAGVIGLILILAFSAWLRFDGLGRYSFWTDEMYHVVAAQSMLEAGRPIVPGRGEYWRSLPTTILTATSFSVFAESEWSARLPFALIAMGFLAIAYKVLAARFSRMLALITVLFIGLSPQFLQIGRECRMYSLFVLLYFLGTFMVFRAVESPPGGPRRGPKGVAIGLAAAAAVMLFAIWVQYLAVSIGISFAMYCLVMAGCVAARSGLGDAIRSRYSVLIGLMLVGAAGIAFALPATTSQFIQLARTPVEWDTRGHPAPFCLWFFNYYYPALWYVYPIGAVLLIRRFGRLGVFIVCAFLPVLLAHMYLFTSRIAERYLVYILPFFFLTSACVIESLVWAIVGWVGELRRSGARATAFVAAVCALPAAWIFLHPWITLSQELRYYGVGPDWKQIAPEIRKAADTGIIISSWPREVMYYGGRFPDFFATQTYEQMGRPDHTVTIGDRQVKVNYLLDAQKLSEVLRSEQDVYFITTDWAFRNDAFLDQAMRDLIREQMTETVSVASGEDRLVIYRHTAK